MKKAILTHREQKKMCQHINVLGLTVYKLHSMFLLFKGCNSVTFWHILDHCDYGSSRLVFNFSLFKSLKKKSCRRELLHQDTGSDWAKSCFLSSSHRGWIGILTERRRGCDCHLQSTQQLNTKDWSVTNRIQWPNYSEERKTVPSNS